jgi:hypothetical protein
MGVPFGRENEKRSRNFATKKSSENRKFVTSKSLLLEKNSG